ncbi:hypothetical protein FA13DRAFT_320457 [Coprinellus micaceus]|uniref:Uncharacterized protein n=1 Tax=Coprinellus micaceus TaxID=71717 RepID=A0A4Y7TD03_COPMI|nr:hypothetical protein FA13DRAFT_320457 [Coprinellus micaceus]
MPLPSGRTVRRSKHLQRGLNVQLVHKTEHRTEGLTGARPSDCPPSIDARIGPSATSKRAGLVKRQLPIDANEDPAPRDRTKRPRLKSTTPPISRIASTEFSHRSPSSRRTSVTSPHALLHEGDPWARFPGSVDNQHPSADAVSWRSLEDVTTSSPSLVASSSMATDGAESSQAIQTFFENASNITIGCDFLVNSYITGSLDGMLPLRKCSGADT